MSMQFVPLVVRALRPETADAYTIEFNRPAAGFDYRAGQYLTLKVDVGGESLRRAFSLSTTPGVDAHLAVTIKCIDGGRVSNHLRNTLQPGHTVDALPPMGNFTLVPDAAQVRHHVLIGCGSGITPLMSMLQAVLAQEPRSRVSLLYGNRSVANIIFRERLAQLQTQHPDRLQVQHVLSRPEAGWQGRTGRLDEATLRDLLVDLLRDRSLETQFYLCGPEGMMSAARSVLRSLAVADSHVHTEYYSAPVAQDEAAAEADADEEYEIVTQQVRVRLDGKEYDITVPPDRSILHAAIDAGLDPPYACEEGVCCTCRAQLHDGLVQMNEREGLSDEEIEAGYVLTCQCHPLTEGVVVEFG